MNASVENRAAVIEALALWGRAHRAAKRPDDRDEELRDYLAAFRGVDPVAVAEIAAKLIDTADQFFPRIAEVADAVRRWRLAQAPSPAIRMRQLAARHADALEGQALAMLRGAGLEAARMSGPARMFAVAAIASAILRKLRDANAGRETIADFASGSLSLAMVEVMARKAIAAFAAEVTPSTEGRQLADALARARRECAA